MILNRKILRMFFLFISLLSLVGCLRSANNSGRMTIYLIPEREASWIQEGRPIEYEGKLWYPQDDVEVFLDTEMNLLGEYQGVQFFADKKDVKPHNRIYTKFASHSFRFYEMKP